MDEKIDFLGIKVDKINTKDTLNRILQYAASDNLFRGRFKLKFLLIFLPVYLLTMAGYIDIIDGESMYQVAKSITDRATLAISDDDHFAALGSDGKYYSSEESLQSFFTVPLILSGKFVARIFHLPVEITERFFASSLGSFITACSCLLIFLFCSKFGCNFKISFFIAFCYGFATMAWPYAKSYFSEPLQSFTLLSAVYFLFSYKLKGKLRYIILAGLAMGAMVMTKTSLAMFLPFLLAYLILALRRDTIIKHSFYFFISLLLLIIFVLWYNQIRYGSIFNARSPCYLLLLNPYHLDPLQIVTRIPDLFIYSPILIIGIFGFKYLYRDYPKEAILFAALILARWLVCFLYRGTFSGGWTWGPRYLMPIIAFCIIPLGNLLNHKFSVKFKRLFIMMLVVILVISIIVQLIAIMVAYTQYFDLKNKLSDAQCAQLPHHIIANIIFIKHKIDGPNEVYDLKTFNHNLSGIVDMRTMKRYKGFNFWFLHIRHCP